MICVYFGEYLRAKRKGKYFSCKMLATMLEVSPSYLSSLENGSRTAPSFSILKKAADILELSTEERYLLYDLAAKSKNPPALADDLIAYINQNPKLNNLLRYTMNCNLTEEDWEKVSKYIKRNYFY